MATDRNDIRRKLKVSLSDGGLNRQIDLEITKEGAVIGSLDVSSVLANESEKRGVFIMGRSTDSIDATVKHDSVSRVHAVLYCAGVKGTLHVMDLGSSKGTTLNDVRLVAHTGTQLSQGDILRLGHSSRTYTVRESERSNLIMQPTETVLEATEEEEHTQEDLDATDINEHVKTIPATSRLDLVGHKKAVVSLTVDASGARPTTGSLDYKLNFYDFGTMDSECQPKHSFEPLDSHPVTYLHASPTGDRILVVVADVNIRVYDRSCEKIVETARGDMYIRDMVHTKGHTMEATMAVWHPNPNKHENLKNVFLSGSTDGSIRLWSLEAPTIFQKLVNRYVLKVKPRNTKGGQRIAIHSVAFSPCGQRIYAGDSQSSIHIYSHHVHPREYAGDGGTKKIAAAAVANTASMGNVFAYPESRPLCILNYDDIDPSNFSFSPIISICFNINTNYMATRSQNGVINIWKNFINFHKKEIKPKIIFNTIIPNLYHQANVVFSPNGDMICAAASCIITQNDDTYSNNDHDISSCLQFYYIDENNKSTDPIFVVPITDDNDNNNNNNNDIVTNMSSSETIRKIIRGGVCVEWCSRSNQIFVTTVTGKTTVFYDSELSTKGAIGVMSRRVKKAKGYATNVGSSRMSDSLIINPHALPMFRNQNIAITKSGNVKTGYEAMKLNKPKRDNDGKLIENRKYLPIKPETSGPGMRPSQALKLTHFAAKRQRVDDDNDPVAALHRKAEEGDTQAQLHDMTAEEEYEIYIRRQKELLALKTNKKSDNN
jgi:WD40 repeat protein